MNNLSSYLSINFIPPQLSAFFSRDAVSSTLSSIQASLPFSTPKIVQVAKERFVHYYRNGGNKVVLPLALISLIGIISYVAYVKLQKNPQSEPITPPVKPAEDLVPTREAPPAPASFIATYEAVQALGPNLCINCFLPKDQEGSGDVIALNLSISKLSESVETKLLTTFPDANIVKLAISDMEALLVEVLITTVQEGVEDIPQFKTRAGKAVPITPAKKDVGNSENTPLLETGNSNSLRIKTAYIAAMTAYKRAKLAQALNLLRTR